MPKGLGYFGSVINTASTRYLDDVGSAAFTGRRKMGPIGERVRNFLMQGQRGTGSLRERGVQTAKRIMEFRGRGLARVGDLPQGAYTTSKAFKEGRSKAKAGGLNPQVGDIIGNVKGLIIGDAERGVVSPRTRMSITANNQVR